MGTDVETHTDAGEDAEQGETAKQEYFGGIGPSEAAKRRWDRARQDKERQKALDAGQAPAGEADARFVTVPIRVGTIIRKLEAEAAKGSTQAARELRAWLSEYPPEEDDFDPAQLPALLRKRLYARLIAEVEAEDAARMTIR